MASIEINQQKKTQAEKLEACEKPTNQTSLPIRLERRAISFG